MKILLQLVMIKIVCLHALHDEYPCGAPEYGIYTNDKVSNRINGGSEAKPHSLPWQALLSILGPGRTQPAICGGTLIPSKEKNRTDLIITAAHCVEYFDETLKFLKGEDITVYLGVHDKSIIEASRTRHKVKSVTVHKSYDTNLIENDIALLQLENAVPYTKETLPACMPKQNEQCPLNVPCVISGWGDRNYKGKIADKLHMAIVEILAKENCKGNPEKEICAKGNGHTCWGDSGGPLVCPIDGQYTLCGVLSSSNVRCTSTRLTNVPIYADWIKKQMKKLTSTNLNIPKMLLPWKK